MYTFLRLKVIWASIVGIFMQLCLHPGSLGISSRQFCGGSWQTEGQDGLHNIHSFIYLHFMDPYMARKPVDIEIVNDDKTSHINNIITNYTQSITITHIFKTNYNELIIKQL
jgi:hypothetical protein